MPAEGFGSLQVGGLCCKGGPVSASIFSPKKAYVPSEKLPFEVDLKNHSRKKVFLRVNLTQVYEKIVIQESVKQLFGKAQRN